MTAFREIAHCLAYLRKNRLTGVFPSPRQGASNERFMRIAVIVQGNTAMDVKTEMLAIMAKLDECLERVDHLIIADRSADGRLGTLSDDLATAHDSAKEVWKRA